MSAIAWIKYYLNFHQKRMLAKVFFEYHFKYCSLTWMFHSQTSNYKINLLHERALGNVYQESQTSSFEEPL